MTFESVVNETVGSIGTTFGSFFNDTRQTFEVVFNEELGQNIVEWLKFLGITFGYSLLGGLAAIGIFYLALCVLGFTCTGVLAGSCAACCQSGIGDVVSGSWFAWSQSAGALGACWQFNLFLYLIGFFTTGTLLILQKVNQDESHSGFNNSTMNATPS